MSFQSSKPVIVVMAKQEDRAKLLSEELKQIAQTDYAGQFDILSVIEDQETMNILQRRSVLAFIIDTLDNDDLSIAGRIKAYSPQTSIILQTKAPADLGYINHDIHAHFYGPLELDKISEEIRLILNQYLQQSLSIQLENSARKVDNILAIIKGSIGLLPVGSLIAEVLGVVIPNQRMLRFEKFLHALAAKIASLEAETTRIRMQNPAFIDLLEDASFQSVRAITDQRLEDIVTLLKNGLTDEDSEIVAYKTILALLAEINDIEVLLLQYYGIHSNITKQQEFYQKHINALKIPTVVMGVEQKVIDQATLHHTYRTHLVRIGLLKITFKKPRKGELPVFDEDTGMIEAKGHQITSLGRLLLRYIDRAEL